MMIMCLFWDTQTEIFGQERSLVLFITVFGTSFCDCMTSIIFWVFVAWFPTQYMTALSAGESSSGIISAILIWIQQLNRADGDPRYSVGLYLFCIGLFIPISGIAFTILLYYLKKGYFHGAKDWISNNPSPTMSDIENHDPDTKETMQSPLSKMDSMAIKNKVDDNERVEVIELIENNTNYGSNEKDDEILSPQNEDIKLKNVSDGYLHWIIMI